MVALFAIISTACSEPATLHDAITAAAQDLRWNKKASTSVLVKVRQPTPVVVLVLGPGAYTLKQRQALLSSPEARELLAKHPYVVEPDVTSVYIFFDHGSEGMYFHDDHFFAPRPLSLWKRDDSPLEVSLERSGDDVRITSVR